MRDTRVLVTGGAGFIGSNVANTLADTNDVIAVDNCHLGTPDNLSEDVEFRSIDVLADSIPTDVDVVCHFAALSSYAMHEEDPAEGARVNVEGFVNTVEQARRDGCDTIVYASTSSIYGGKDRPNRESMSVEANTAYEASKLARERYAEYFSAHYGMNLAGLRFFSVYQGYGGHEAHKGEYANVIAQFADDIANDREPVLYGDGTQTRDFTHIDDVVSAVTAAAEHGLDGIYNVGTGEAVTFNELVDRLAAILGVEIEPRYVDNPINEDVYVSHTQADHSRLQSACGWEPEVGLADGLQRVCDPYLDSSLE